MFKVFGLFTLAAFVAVGHSSSNNSTTDRRSPGKFKKAFFANNPASTDYKLIGENEEHRYGVELEENKQFHHTTTAEDGVRLGCYGHTQDGKTYSTHYVADNKGYRLVPHDQFITVYPRNDGKPRNASFVSAFDEFEANKLNIQYFFPKGCKSPKLKNIPPIQKKSDAVDAPTTVITTTTPKPTTVPSTTSQRPTTVTTTTTLMPTTVPSTTTPIITTFRRTTNSPSTTTEPEPVIEEIVPLDNEPIEETSSCSSDSCCHESQAQIILPSKDDSCCQDHASLVIPIPFEQLVKIPIAEIQSLNDEKDLTLMLINLIRFVEKCREKE